RVVVLQPQQHLVLLPPAQQDRRGTARSVVLHTLPLRPAAEPRAVRRRLGDRCPARRPPRPGARALCTRTAGDRAGSGLSPLDTGPGADSADYSAARLL